MILYTEKQVKFHNFAEVKTFLNEINEDVDLSRSAPDCALFSKSKGLVAGLGFAHLCSRMNEIFGLELDHKGCVQSYAGYTLTFKDKVPYDQIEKNKLKKELFKKDKKELVEFAFEKGLELKSSLKKEEMVLAILSA